MLKDTTHIERMIMSAMQIIAPDVLRYCWENCGESKGPHQLSYKACLLQQLMKEKGPGAVLGLFKHISVSALSSSLVYLLLNSSTPRELMEKVKHYGSYFHATRRLELIDTGEDYVVVENIANDGGVPLPEEELFLCGMLMNLLERIGCEGLEVQWLATSSQDLSKILKSMDLSAPEYVENSRWRFVWHGQKIKGHIEGLDEFLFRYAEPFRLPSKVNLIDMVEKILSIDLGAKPSMEVMAEMLGMSVRSFQRKMREEGTTYTRLCNDLRIKVASRMLRQSEVTVTEVGFVCGFRDSSHFSREFKKVQQVSPKRYREMFKGRR